MAKVFFKIQEKFTISNLIEEDEDDPVGPISKQFKETKPQQLDITLMRDDGSLIGFTPFEVVSGNFKIELIGDNIEVDCDAIFKIDAKNEYLDELLTPNRKWACNGLQGIFGEISGLEQEKYKFKNRFSEGESVRHLLKIKVAKTEKELT
jgi:hypothetical protein